MFKYTLINIALCLSCGALILLIGNIVYEAILAKRFYKHMKEQHDTFMKSLERDREQR